MRRAHCALPKVYDPSTGSRLRQVCFSTFRGVKRRHAPAISPFCTFKHCSVSVKLAPCARVLRTYTSRLGPADCTLPVIRVSQDHRSTMTPSPTSPGSSTPNNHGYDVTQDGPTRHGPRKRRKITRSKLGCLTCRRRKKLCNMAHPVCESCSRLGRVSRLCPVTHNLTPVGVRVAHWKSSDRLGDT